MNAGPDVERLISSWLREEAPGRAPDRLLEAAGRTIDRTRQRRFAAWWAGSAVRPRGFAAAWAIGALIVAGVAVLALRPGTGPGNPPSPSPTAIPSPTAAAASPYPTNIPIVLGSLLPEPAGDPLPATLIGHTYEVNPPSVQGTQQEMLTLRAADDPHCVGLFGGRSTCFTILWTPNGPKHINDPAARGSARIVEGSLVLGFDWVPYDKPCEGTSATYAIEDDGAILRGINPPACAFPGFREP